MALGLPWADPNPTEGQGEATSLFKLESVLPWLRLKDRFASMGLETMPGTKPDLYFMERTG